MERVVLRTEGFGCDNPKGTDKWTRHEVDRIVANKFSRITVRARQSTPELYRGQSK